MSCWKYGVSQSAIAFAISALVMPLPALANPFTAPDGTTLGSQTLSGNETGTVEAGGAVSGGTGINLTGASSGTGAVIDNAGNITGTSRGIDTSSSNSTRTITLTNRAGGVITGTGNDGFRINTDVSSGTITVNNSGTILSTGGQAIDFDSISAGTATVIINNLAGGLIKATTADAVRPGQSAIVTNYGTIFSDGVAGDSNDGVDFQSHSGTVINKTGGLISGFHHGMTSDADIQVTNEAGATIIGRNGSGVGSDGTGTVVNHGRITGAYDGSGTGDGDGVDIDLTAAITNYGIIEGTGAAGFKDGLANASEGISIGGGVILNYGSISGANSGIVVNDDANLDRSGNAATMLTNYGSITGVNGYAIRMENKTGTAADNDTIINYGTITGNGVIPDPSATVLTDVGTPDPAFGTLNGVTYASGSGSARFIRGDGSAIQMGEGADQLTNYGTIIGNTGRAINLEGGNDRLSVMAGSRIVGLADGGAGTDTLDYNKIGLSAAKQAALAAGQTVNVGGTLYTGFELFTGVTSSFSSFATDSTTQNIASILDNGSTTVAASAATQTLIDKVASATDVSAALAQLTPAAFQGLTAAGIDNAIQTGQIVDQRLSGVRSGGVGPLAFAGLDALALLQDDRGSLSSVSSASTAGDAGADAAFAYAATSATAANQAFASVDAKHARRGAGFLKAPAMLDSDAPWGLFIYGNAMFARQGAHDSAPQSRFNAAGVTFGLDRRIGDDLVIGLLGGYTRTNADLDTVGSTSKIDTWLAGLYGTYYRQNWFLNGAFVYGRNSYDNNRVALGTSNTSSPKGDQIVGQASIGFTTPLGGGWTVTPELGAQYTTVRIDGFSEAGPAALAVDADRAESLRSSLGARFRYDMVTASGRVTPELRASWQHEFLDSERDLRASFVDQSLPGTFSTTAAGSGHDFGVVGAGLTGSLSQRTQLSLDYDFKFGGYDFTAHQISARLRHVF